MTTMRACADPQLAKVLGRLVYGEFELLEASQDEAAVAEGVEAARLARQSGVAQIHIFEMDSLLRTIQRSPITYSRCVRNSLRGFSQRSAAQVRGSLIARYQDALMGDLPPRVRDLLESHLAEHLGISIPRRLVVSARHLQD
jgi:hypothetical protein